MVNKHMKARTISFAISLMQNETTSDTITHLLQRLQNIIINTKC